MIVIGDGVVLHCTILQSICIISVIVSTLCMCAPDHMQADITAWFISGAVR